VLRFHCIRQPALICKTVAELSGVNDLSALAVATAADATSKWQTFWCAPRRSGLIEVRPRGGSGSARNGLCRGCGTEDRFQGAAA
jgi:hypothetical protein